MAREPKNGWVHAQEALDRAQSLAFDAWEARTAKRRVALAEKALSISPLCADAYALLALHAEPGSEAELDFWRRGVEAGRQALGAEVFEQDAGDFWGLLETRPFMRALHGLAGALWERGLHEQAAEHFQEMLRLNPNDNQGARYSLAAVLLESGGDDQLAALFETYPDDSMATWSYTRALAAFRCSGDDAASRATLAAALKSNAHVPAYLTGLKKMPTSLPAYYSPGEASEAICYVEDGRKGWELTPGALDWLSAHAPKRPSGRASAGASPRRPKRKE